MLFPIFQYANVYVSDEFHNITIRLTDTRLYDRLIRLSSAYVRELWLRRASFFESLFERKFVIKIWRHVSDLTRE